MGICELLRNDGGARVEQQTLTHARDAHAFAQVGRMQFLYTFCAVLQEVCFFLSHFSQKCSMKKSMLFEKQHFVRHLYMQGCLRDSGTKPHFFDKTVVFEKFCICSTFHILHFLSHVKQSTLFKSVLFQRFFFVY